ncbi:MAG: single-stranded-DNA-specific exonuclease RecJ [Chloroflexi bacterium]|nr:single-stranded-DNA-specific exonuclease RecJ [Chloroflexota bacterium]
MHGISQVMAQVLINRGFSTPQQAWEFLRAADLTSGRYLSLKGKHRAIDRAVSRLVQAVERQEKIIVYGDFDADGVTSTVLLVQVLKSLGANVEPYIPNRIDEGYGLNAPALRSLKYEYGAQVVITVDCGIRSVQEVEDGKRFGLDMIVTDHHSIGPDIPDAHAVINPKLQDFDLSPRHACPYSEDMLAGVGVAYRVAEALLTVAGANSKLRRLRKPLELDDLLDLVAIGTVADLAPLNRTENRALVRRGLERMNQHPRPGIRALLDVAGVKPGTVSAMTIGFAIGPRINAAGRLADAMIAYRLLAATTEAEAMQYAQQLQELNTQRQTLTREAQGKIKESIEAIHDQPLIFAGDAGFQPGIVGLVAGRLVEEYFRPAVVMEYGREESRASCRSIPQFDITRALDNCADLLVRHGGHAQAAGFTVSNQNIDALRERLLELARNSLDGQELKPVLEIDADVNINQLTEKLVEELQQLEPTGHMNPSPVLMSRNVLVKEKRTVGADGKHLKLKLARAGQRDLDAIGFSLGERAGELPDYVDVAYQLEMNEWNGSRSLQLNLQDIRPAGAARGR